MTVPALRAALNCTVVPRDSVDIKYDNNYTLYARLTPQPTVHGNRQSLNYSFENYELYPNQYDGPRFAIFNVSDVS